MCLKISLIRHLRLKPKIAKKDIFCYKALTINYNCEELKLVTPFQRKPVLSHKYKQFPLIYDHCLIADHFEEYPSLMGDSFVIDHAIHSYRKINAIRNSYYDIVICACIPKGTKYWIGKDGDIASERIIFTI